MPALRIFRLGRVRNAYLLRGLAVWMGLRLAAAFFGLITLPLLGSIFVLVMVALAGFLDARRREEDVFLGNLGVPGSGIVLATLPIPLLFELLLP